MLEEFLTDLGMFHHGQRIADSELLKRLSDWVKVQVVQDDDFSYLVARMAAFICEYLIDGYSAERYVRNERIWLRLPIDASRGVSREFDPYAVAVSLVRERGDLEKFLKALCA